MTIKKFYVMAYLISSGNEVCIPNKITNLDDDMVKFIISYMKSEYSVFDEQGHVKVDVVYNRASNVFNVTLDGDIFWFDIHVDAEDNYPYMHNGMTYLIHTWTIAEYCKIKKLLKYIPDPVLLY